MFKAAFLGAIVASGLSACSLYQSEGRKFLEKQALEFAGVSAQAHLTGCEHNPVNDGWEILDNTVQAAVFATETDGFELAIRPHRAPDFRCTFRFESAREMFEKTGPAIDLTLLYQSLGSFAFRPDSLLK